MNDEFKIDDRKITDISAAFSVKKESVENMYKYYGDFSPYLKNQYLAHLMRGLEAYFRKRLSSNFVVVCEPYKKISAGQKNASADYFQGRKFVINYNQSLPDKKIRDYIAHEIGHLFVLAVIDIISKDKRKNMYTGSVEPLSSIFGIFAMAEKNDYYANYDISAENHKDWQELLDYFNAIKDNRL